MFPATHAPPVKSYCRIWSDPLGQTPLGTAAVLFEAPSLPPSSSRRRLATGSASSLQRQQGQWRNLPDGYRSVTPATSPSFNTTAAPQTRSRSSSRVTSRPAPSSISPTMAGWPPADSGRAKSTVTYTAPTAITAGTVITLTGLNLDDAGDQIIAYQGDRRRAPTILYLVDLADGNNTVAGDATNDNTTALPPGLTLGQNAVAVGFDNAIYAGPIDGSPPQLFPLISNSANWIDSDALPPSFRYYYPPHLDLDSNNSTSGGDDYRAEVTSDGTPVPIADTDSDIDDFDGGFITFAQINIKNQFPGDVLSVNGTLPFGIFATPFDPFTGILTLFGYASHSAYQTAIEQIGFSTDAPVGVTKSIAVWVFDGFWWSNEATAIITVTSAAAPPHPRSRRQQLQWRRARTIPRHSPPAGRRYRSPTPTFPSPTPTARRSSRPGSRSTINRQSGDALIAGALPPGITASSYNPFTGVLTLSGAASLADYQTALRQVVFDTTSISTADRIIRVTVNDGTFDSNVATTYMHVVLPPPNVPPVLDLDANNSTTHGRKLSHRVHRWGPGASPSWTPMSRSSTTTVQHLASATVTLTNGDLLDSLTFNGTAPRRHLRFRLGDRSNYALGRRIGCRLSDGTAANQVQQHRHQSFDRNPRRRHCRQRRRRQQQHGTGPDPGRGGEQQRSGAGPRCRRLERLVSKHFPERVHGKRRSGADRRCRYLHYRCRQLHDFVRDDHAGEPANRRSAHGQRDVAGSDHHGWLRSWYRRPHAHRYGHAG